MLVKLSFIEGCGGPTPVLTPMNVAAATRALRGIRVSLTTWSPLVAAAAGHAMKPSGVLLEQPADSPSG